MFSKIFATIDARVSYQFSKFRFETSLNNLADRAYFTRRATGHPGPGILPPDGRSLYVTLQLNQKSATLDQS